MDQHLQRYTALERRLSHLERVHLDAKHAHRAETQRLTQDLSRCQRTLSQQTDHIHKQKNHNDALESRIRDLEKAAIADHSQIKSLRAKATRPDLYKRITDLESQLAQSHRALRQRNDPIPHLEKTLESEKTCNPHPQHSDSHEQDVSIPLKNAKSLLSHTAQLYGQLAATSVPSTTHNQLQQRYHTALFTEGHLKRKLANAEDQVQQLASLLRQSNDRMALLESHLADANDQLAIYETKFTEPLFSDSAWLPVPTQATDHQDVKEAQSRLHDLLATYYRLYSQQLVFAYTSVDNRLSTVTSLAQQLSLDLANTRASHKTTIATLETAQHQSSTLSEELLTIKASHTTLQSTCTSLETQIASFKKEREQLVLDHQIEIKNDRDAVVRLTSAVQQNRMAADALRTEIDRLLVELAEAEPYQEAYTALSEQVTSLLAQNHLAQKEAEQLRKFNAEILGHRNPAQRISYVDRIRRELAETRQRLVIVTREQENIIQLNADLQHELEMYKSVADKQRTHITRIQRAPLSNATRIINSVKSQLLPEER